MPTLLEGVSIRLHCIECVHVFTVGEDRVSTCTIIICAVDVVLGTNSAPHNGGRGDELDPGPEGGDTSTCSVGTSPMNEAGQTVSYDYSCKQDKASNPVKTMEEISELFSFEVCGLQNLACMLFMTYIVI